MAGARTGTCTLWRSAGLAAVGTGSSTDGVVKFSSGGTVDSYDSSRGDYPAQTPGYSAIVAGNAVTLTNAQIKGYVATNGGTLTYGSSGTVTGPNTTTGVKIDPARVSSTPYQCDFDIAPPTGAGSLLPSGTATVGSPGDTTPRIYYGTNTRIYNGTTLTVDGTANFTNANKPIGIAPANKAVAMTEHECKTKCVE